MKVQYHTSCGDHIPLTLDISTECIPELETVDDDSDNLRVNWSKRSAANLEESESESEIFIRSYYRPRRPLLRPYLVAVAEATWKNKK